MKNTSKIIQRFHSTAKLFSEHKVFSAQPGIYAVLYFGKSKLLGAISGLKSGQIIYIGKTLSSQQSRDADTHFKSGKSGSSTVRRSIGALLREEMKFFPIPRGSGKTDMDTINYCFDEKSEEVLTSWMIDNLGLAFFEYPKSSDEIRSLELKLLDKLFPVLNIESNSANPFLSEVKTARAKCKNFAEQKAGKINPTVTTVISKVVEPKRATGSAGVHKYEVIWKGVLPMIKECLSTGKDFSSMKLTRSQFDAAGNRKSYSFNIQYQNGKLMNSLDGSAVARDLDRMIIGNADYKQLLKGKSVKLAMGKDFVFKLTIH